MILLSLLYLIFDLYIIILFEWVNHATRSKSTLKINAILNLPKSYKFLKLSHLYKIIIIKLQNQPYNLKLKIIKFIN